MFLPLLHVKTEMGISLPLLHVNTEVGISLSLLHMKTEVGISLPLLHVKTEMGISLPLLHVKTEIGISLPKTTRTPNKSNLLIPFIVPLNDFHIFFYILLLFFYRMDTTNAFLLQCLIFINRRTNFSSRIPCF
jgi:hypothetical protein